MLQGVASYAARPAWLVEAPTGPARVGGLQLTDRLGHRSTGRIRVGPHISPAPEWDADPVADGDAGA
jgi:hypothetical protein